MFGAVWVWFRLRVGLRLFPVGGAGPSGWGGDAC